VHLDPAFIRRAILLHPEEALEPGNDGNYPLHVEASIPIEKMMLLETERKGCCSGACQKRMSLIETLFDIYPEAACQKNDHGEYPLHLMIRSGHPCNETFVRIVKEFPQAVSTVEDLDPSMLPLVLQNMDKQCGTKTVYRILRDMPRF
jgi:hypothetical protein